MGTHSSGVLHSIQHAGGVRTKKPCPEFSLLMIRLTCLRRYAFCSKPNTTISSLHPRPRACSRQFESEDLDLVLIDLNYARDTTSGSEGLELLPRIQALDPTLPDNCDDGLGQRRRCG